MPVKIIVGLILLAEVAFWFLVIRRFARDKDRMNRVPLLVGMIVVAAIVLAVTGVALFLLFNPDTTVIY